MQKKLDVLDSLSQIADCTPGSLYWKDTEGRYLGCNKFMADTAGLDSTKSIIGKTDEELWPEYGAQLSHNDQYVIDSGKTIYLEEKVDVNGTTMHFVGVKAPLKNTAGKTIGIIGNSLDITQLKHIQTQLELDKKAIEAENHAKSEFIANMSHDIRTPLAGIIGLTEILITSLRNSAVVKFAKDAHRAANQLMQLLNEILEISDIDNDKSIDNEQVFSLQTIFESIRELMVPSVEHRGLTFNIDFDTKIPSNLMGHRILLHRILLNLISNAIKFTPKGNINLSAELLEQDENGVTLKLCVADTGIGIPNDKLEEIFEPFKRLSPAYENNYQGTGLGLYVVKKFVTRMQGKLKVHSELNQGTSFELVLPLRTSSSSIQQQSSTDAMGKVINELSDDYKRPAPNCQYKVLVVEDDPMAQIVSKIQLSSQECDVDIAINSKEAVICAQQKHYDLILMDIGLPDKDGCETTREIRRNEQKIGRAPTPIVALTAHINEKNQHECKNAGINYVLQKPLSYNLTQKIIQTCLIDRMNSNQKTSALDAAAINLDEATRILGGNKELALELLTLFIQQLPDVRSKIQHAHQKKDWIALRQILHKLHGAASYCGIGKLRAICFNIENQLKNDSSCKIDEAEMGQLFAEISIIEKAFKEIKATD